MVRLEDISEGICLQGILPNQMVTVEFVRKHGPDVIDLHYKDSQGKTSNQLLYRMHEIELEIIEEGRPWSFDGDGRLFRLLSEAHRINLAHMFDPLLAIHTSLVDPYPHQIKAVYEYMLPRQPLRFLLADDPGAGKTIMAGLLIKELIVRGDVRRCLIVCPGSLAEQWQDELDKRFQLPFKIMTNDEVRAARTGNYFIENDLVIARLDKLSRNEDLQDKLSVDEADWDLVICDESHKMSASFFGGEIKKTKRYQLGERLSKHSRHFLLITATPHNGKEEDFQLFLALIDNDRFEGGYRNRIPESNISDMMRRMIKEDLRKFDGTPLFPKRIARTIPYQLSESEHALYEAVTNYVKGEFDRAEKLLDNKQSGNVGFALTILQRRLASSPEAIFQSLRRRRERLERKLIEIETQEGTAPNISYNGLEKLLDDEDLSDFDDATSREQERIENQILDQATAAQTIEELNAEIENLMNLANQADQVRKSGTDKKWQELEELLTYIFSMKDNNAEKFKKFESKDSVGHTFEKSPLQKLVIFTEHRDTLSYLERKISKILSANDSIVSIHGNVGREERRKIQDMFLHDPNVKVLIATDAAGEGINLQRSHLMVNYDLPWNPNRIEQRFGRIHRIGQKNHCFLWNLVANETREGDVYFRLLEKLEQASSTLGGKVFNVLGKFVFDGKSLKNLLIDAIRHSESPEMKNHFENVVDGVVNVENLEELMEENALSLESMDTSKVMEVRNNMERAEAKRLQPHFIESFFCEAFKELGGKIFEKEERRYEINHVPIQVRRQDRIIGTGDHVLPKYERIVFEKDLMDINGFPPAAFVCPGHPILDATTNLILEQNRDLLRRGTILVDEDDTGCDPKIIFYLQHEVRDGRLTKTGDRQLISRKMLYVELDSNDNILHFNYAPYLDYRPLKENEPTVKEILEMQECGWVKGNLEDKATNYAINSICPDHLEEMKAVKKPYIDKIRDAVIKRLSKEIEFWEQRTEELRDLEMAGQPKKGISFKEADRRKENLRTRLEDRLNELKLEENLVTSPPTLTGGFLIVPLGLLAKISTNVSVDLRSINKLETAAKAREIVMDEERKLGFEPKDRENEKLGYDIESRDPLTGKLRFIEVKGRIKDAATITVTRNEIICSLNKPEDYILAIVEFSGDNFEDDHKVFYKRKPFGCKPDFGVTSVNYKFSEILNESEPPR